MIFRYLSLFAGISVWLLSSPAAAQDYRYLSTNFSLTDLDIGKLVDRLSRVGINIPLELEGDATVRLRLEIPVNALRDGAAYRFDGSISSARLKVENLQLLNVAMEAVYREGVLNLDPLAFQIPDANPNGLPPGRFRGTGRFELVPQGELALNLNLESAPAAALSAIAAQPPLLDGGTVSGQVTADVMAEDVQDVAAWNMQGQFTASDLKAADRVLQAASFRFLLDNGELRAQELTARMEGAKLSGAAMAVLTGDTSYSSDLKLEITELAKLVPGTDAIQTEDPLSATAKISGRLSPFTVAGNGEATLPETTIGRLKLQSGGLEYSMTDERFAIDSLNVTLYEGNITGSAVLPREGEAPANLSVQFQDPLDLDSLADELSGTDLELAGGITGELKAQAPRGQIGELPQWDASANISIEEGSAWGLAIERAGINLLLQNGVVSLSETGLSWANSVLDLSGRLALAEPQAFAADVKLTAGDLKDLNQLSGDVELPLGVAGQIEAKGNVKGQLQDFNWQADGQVTSEQLTFDKIVVDSLSSEVEATPEAVSLASFDLKLYEGTMTGRGQYPLEPNGTGEFQFDWEKIDLGKLVPLYSQIQTPVEGAISGKATASLGAEPERGERPVAVEANFQMPTITVGAVEAGNLTGKVEYKDDRLDYRVLGKLFDGDFELEGELPAASKPEPEPAQDSLPGQGRIELENMQLNQAARLFARNLDALDLAGEVSVSFAWSPAEAGKPDGSGTVRLTNVALGGRRITDRLEGDVLLRGSRLVANNVQGTFAGAQLQIEAVWGLGADRSRLLNLRAINLDSAFLAELTPIPADLIEGRLDMEAVIIPQEIWRVQLRIKAPQLTVAGVAVQSVTLPIRGTVLPTLARGELTIRSLGASFAGGRVQGHVSLGWGERRNVRGNLKFTKVDTISLVRQLWGSDLPGDGKLSGSVEFEGNNLRNWTDVAAVIDAKLSRAQPRKLPVVEALESVARTVSLSQPVEEGQIKARYAKGAIRISELTLSGPTLEIYMVGGIAANKRLNLNVFIKTGRRSIDRRISHLIGGRLGDRVIGILADRLIQAKVTGTINRPIVHVKPLSFVNIKALR